MSTTYRTHAPDGYQPRHRRPMDRETSGLIAAGLIWVVGTVAGIVMTAVA